MVGEKISPSMYGYPGHVSVIIDLNSSRVISTESVLKDNPMLSAVLFKGSRLEEKDSPLIEWAKTNKLRMGFEAEKNFDIDGGRFLENMEFFRLRTTKIDEEMRKKLGKIRAHGIRNEIVYSPGKRELGRIEEFYNECGPCDVFVVELKERPSEEEFKRVMELGDKYGNLILRFDYSNM